MDTVVLSPSDLYKSKVMAETGILNSGEITRKEFDAALKLYPSLIQKISASKAGMKSPI